MIKQLLALFGGKKKRAAKRAKSSNPKSAYPSNVVDLNSAVEHIKKNLSKADIKYIKAQEFSNVYYGDMFSGMSIRNNLGLWDKKSKLNIWFRENYQLGHADDTSTIINDCLFKDIKGEPRNIKKMIDFFKDFWLEQGIDPLTLETIDFKKYEKNKNFTVQVKKNG